MPFKGHKLKKEVEREKRKAELGVCRIRQLLKDGEGFETVGCGSVIKNLTDYWPWKDKCCVVTSDKALPEEDFDINDFFLDFRKLNSTIKTVRLNSIAKSDAVYRSTSGLVVIPLDPGFLPNVKISSIFTYRPFTKGDELSAELFCPIVDDTDLSSFDVKPFRLKQMLDLPQFVLHDGRYSFNSLAAFTGSSNRKPIGAVILFRGAKVSSPNVTKENLKAVGVLNCQDDESSRISPVWLSLENLSSLSKYKIVPAYNIERDQT